MCVPVFHASALNPCTCGRETCVNPKNKELGSCKVTKETLFQQSSRGFLSSSGDKLAQAFSLGCWSQQDIIHVTQLAKCQLRLKLKVRALVVPTHGAPKEKQEKGVYMAASTWPWPGLLLKFPSGSLHLNTTASWVTIQSLPRNQINQPILFYLAKVTGGYQGFLMVAGNLEAFL